MPRMLPRYDQAFAASIAYANAYISRIEQARVAGAVKGGQRVTVADLEYSYELAYLRIFLAWEELLEKSLTRLICGYHHSGGSEPLVAGGTYFTTLSAAEAAILDGRAYQLWHDPVRVINRCRRFLHGGRYDTTLASAQTTLQQFADVRHRIAHSQKDGERKFNAVTMGLAGRRYLASRPGRFLRDTTVVAGVKARWLTKMSAQLEALAFQICG